MLLNIWNLKEKMIFELFIWFDVNYELWLLEATWIDSLVVTPNLIVAVLSWNGFCCKFPELLRMYDLPASQDLWLNLWLSVERSAKFMSSDIYVFPSLYLLLNWRSSLILCLTRAAILHCLLDFCEFYIN